MTQLRSVVVVIVTFVLALATMWVVLDLWFAYGATLAGGRPATCRPTHCFCEAIRPTGLAQPANTWSCVAFIWLAFGIVADALRLRRLALPNALGWQPANAVAFALALLLTGMGSAAYHASLTFVGQFADVLGMYFIATFLIIYQLNRRRPLPAARVIAMFLFSNAVLAAILWYAPLARRYAFALLILTVIVLEIRLHNDGRVTRPALFFGAVGVLAFGFVLWVLDISRAVCAPTSVIQGHAFWHVAGAMASLLVYLYFRSERQVSA